jgi:hypothetical protein
MSVVFHIRRDQKANVCGCRMSWLRTAALRVNGRLGSSGGALLALTRLDVANNELRALPPDLFVLLSLRYVDLRLRSLTSPADLAGFRDLLYTVTFNLFEKTKFRVYKNMYVSK